MGQGRRTLRTALAGPALLLLAACGRRVGSEVDATGAIRVRWITRLEWGAVGGPGGVGRVQRSYLVVGPLDVTINRQPVRCAGARERLAVHPVSPVVAWRCRADEPWQAAWYAGARAGTVRLGDCLQLGRGAAPVWSTARVSIDASRARCVARIHLSDGPTTASAYELIDREAGAGGLADALAALVAAADVTPPDVEFRAAVSRLAPAPRAVVSSALRAAAMAPACDASRAVLASELLDLGVDDALTDALVAHLARLWQPWLPTHPSSGWNTTRGAPFQPMLQRLIARLSPLRPGPVGQIGCAVTRIRVNGRVDGVAAARAAVLRAGTPCPTLAR